MIGVLIELLLEIAGETLFAMAGAVLTAALEPSRTGEDRSRRWLAGIGHVVMGAAAGVVSLLVLQQRVVPHATVPGASLLLAPLFTGLLLEWLGRWWTSRGNVRLALFTFRGGFLFALGMAAVRFSFFARAAG